MQKLNIPDMIESENQVVAISDDTVIDSVFFLQCLVREVERREAVNARKGEQRDVHAFGYDIKIPREDVYLAREDGLIVQDVDGLTLLLNEVSDVELIPDYTGKGADKLLVFQLRLPQGWFANVGAIRLEDLPEKAVQDNQPWVHPIRLKKPGGYSTIRHISSRLRPFRSDRALFDLSREKVMQNYHYITVKVNKHDLTLRHWFPGVDIHTGRGPESFVLLGYKPHRPQQQREPQATQQPAQPTRKFTFSQLAKK
jgi:hypothetical protein